MRPQDAAKLEKFRKRFEGRPARAVPRVVSGPGRPAASGDSAGRKATPGKDDAPRKEAAPRKGRRLAEEGSQGQDDPRGRTRRVGHRALARRDRVVRFGRTDAGGGRGDGEDRQGRWRRPRIEEGRDRVGEGPRGGVATASDTGVDAGSASKPIIPRRSARRRGASVVLAASTTRDVPTHPPPKAYP